MFVTEHKLKIIGLLAVLFLFLSTTNAATPPLDDDAETINTQIEAVFALTAESKTADDFTRVIVECKRLTDLELSETQAGYLQTLASWGHRRRGEALLKKYEREIEDCDHETGTDAGAAEIALITKKLTDAISDFEIAAVNSDKPARCFRFHGYALVAAERYEEAVVAFDKSLELEEDHLATIFCRAEIHRLVGQFENAVSGYDRVLEKDSGDLQALTGRGHALMGAGDFTAALKDYSAVSILNDSHPVARINCGDARYAMGEFDAALTDYKTSIACKETGAACCRVAWLAATCPVSKFYKPEYALEMANRAIELSGENLRTLEALAAAHAANGEFDKATEVQQQAVDQLGPDADSNEELVAGPMQRMVMYENNRVYKTDSVVPRTEAKMEPDEPAVEDGATEPKVAPEPDDN